ncbi:hypothetical protein MYX84_06365 [Acidobacteria bacterium AH-259-O06]|nr:hypothetical protein [Acidobacteria bacterium AH-259-O06]
MIRDWRVLKFQGPLLHLLLLVVPVGVYSLRFWEALAGESTLLRGFDASVQSYPWLIKVTRAWRDFDPPLWDFSTFSGTTFIGELQTGVLYPLSMLFAWITDTTTEFSLDVYVLLHYVLAFYFMFLLAKHYHLSFSAALLAAYAFASYLDWAQPNRLFGMIYLPLLLLFFGKSLMSRQRPFLNQWIYYSGIVLALTLLAGHHQPYVHSVLALVFFLFIVYFRRLSLPSKLINLGSVGIVSVLLCAPQLLLSLEYFVKAYRWTPERIRVFERVPYELYGFENTLNPQLEYYLFNLNSWIPAVVIIGLAMILWTTDSRKKRLAIFTLVLGLFAYLASLGDETWLGKFNWYIPFINTVRETERYVFLILFAAAALLGLSVDALLRWTDRLLESWGEISFGTPKIGINFGRIRPYAGLIIFVGFTWWVWNHSSAFLRIQHVEDPLTPARYYQSNGIVEFLQKEFSRQHQLFRVLNFRHCLPPNIGNVYSFHTTSGHRATMYAPYFDFIHDHLANPHSQKFDQLAAKYLVSSDPIQELPLLKHEGGLYLYERPNAVTIFHFYDPESERRVAAKVSRVEWSQNTVRLVLRENMGGRLIFSQPHYPGWKVLVDGEPRELSTEGILMAVQLDGSEREIEFQYNPRAFYLGLTISLLTLVGLAIASFRTYHGQD